MTNLDSVLKSRDRTLPTKVHVVKGMVFPVVMYSCGRRKWQPTSVFLPRKSPWTEEPRKLQSMRSQESDTT